MKIIKLNLALIRQQEDQYDELCFIRLPHSKLFRVTAVPEALVNNEEFFQVLRTLCVREKAGAFFFKIEDDEAMENIGAIMVEMGIDHVFVFPRVIDQQPALEPYQSN